MADHGGDERALGGAGKVRIGPVGILGERRGTRKESGVGSGIVGVESIGHGAIEESVEGVVVADESVDRGLDGEKDPRLVREARWQILELDVGTGGMEDDSVSLWQHRPIKSRFAPFRQRGIAVNLADQVFAAVIKGCPDKNLDLPSRQRWVVIVV